MAVQMKSVDRIATLNEIIDNAIELPLESQNLLLMMAKSMKYTRDCMTKQNEETKNLIYPKEELEALDKKEVQEKQCERAS